MAAGRGELVVVGAALGAGRWLAEQLLAAGDWTRVVLVDTPASAPALLDTAGPVVAAVARDGGLASAADGSPVRIDRAVAAVVAVPAAAVASVLADLAAVLPPAAEVVLVSARLGEVLAEARPHPGLRHVWATHLLFDPALTSGDGQSVFVAPASADADPPAWFAEAVAVSGGLLRTGGAEEHDAAMRVVQATTHRTLVAFADAVTDSGVDLDALWTLRTPLFDSLLGLTARALDPRQQAQIAALQDGADDGPARRLVRAVAEVTDAGGFERAAERARDRISGALFDELRTSAAAGVQAGQAQRREIARHRRDGTVVGLRRIGAPDSVRVGRVAEVTATRVALDVLLSGPSGRAALLDGPGLVNAARLGVPAGIARHDFGIGHVEVLGETALQRLLDERLAFLPRDVRFLVPESVAGSGVARVVAQFGGLRDVRLVDEVVRTGQRSVVVHLAVRADRDVDATVEAVRREVEAAYAWPVGVTRALTRPESSVVYLGPAGTFSEAAARQCAQSIGLDGGRLLALRSFDEVLAAVRPGTLGVLPISSSASGLVSRAVDALLASDSTLVASGVVDVAVRFDAYTRGPAPLEQYRGAAVYSHPQGLAQCARFVRRWGLRPVATASTAEALTMVEHADEPAVALGGAGLDGALRVAEREVDDLSGSITRFLVVGAEGEFATQRDGSDPTLRTAWIGADVTSAPIPLTAGAAFTELLTDAGGRFLLVSSGSAGPVPPGVRLLGVLPWSPRTPLVRPGSD